MLGPSDLMKGQLLAATDTEAVAIRGSPWQASQLPSCPAIHLGQFFYAVKQYLCFFGSLSFEEYFLFNSRQVLSTVTVECWSLKEEPSTKTGINKGKAGINTVSCGGFSWCLWWEKHGKVLDRFSGQHGQLLAWFREAQEAGVGRRLTSNIP